uniref:PHD-type domain-containing protein n=1 Tax=Davidia involucrata TaxID=16924 RepID=A0A5B7AG95_DAVIN
MAKRKERTLKELHNVTEIISEPEVTPVLRGSCLMQGPVDETDYDVQTIMVSSQDEKGFGMHSKSQKVHMRAESGTCNVCSAPCSSCMHINRALMGSNTDEFSDETCQGSAFSQSSVVPPVKSSACDNGQHTASETSNLFSVNSSHDSFSENAESKASLRTSDVSGTSEDAGMRTKLSSGGAVADDQLPLKPVCVSDQRTLKNKFEDPKDLEGHDDNIPCVSGAIDAKKLASYNNGNADRKNMPCSSASASSLVPEGYGKIVRFQTDISSLDSNCNAEGNHRNSRRQSSRYNEECFQKVPPPIILSTSCKLDLLVIPSSTDMDDGAGSPKVKNTGSHPPGCKSLSCNPKLKGLEEDSCSHLQGELPECLKEHLNPLLSKEAASDIVCGQKCASHKRDDIQNNKVSLAGGNSDALEKISPNADAETDNGTGGLAAEGLNASEQFEEVEKAVSVVSSDAQETSLQSQPVDESDDSDILEHDVKVCDICGDAGREDLLAICSRCSDGAEHTYCMQEMLDKVPEGDWLCEECKFNEDFEKQKQDKFGTVDGNKKTQSSGKATAVNTNLSVKFDTKDTDVEGNTTNKDILSAKVSVERHVENIEVISAAKQQTFEPIMGSPKTSSPSKIAALSHDCSFKNLEKGKVKPAHQLSSGMHSINDTLETTCSPTTGPRLQVPRGTLVKSYSFNSSNAKPKVKLVDEAVPQKQKSARESASLDTKDGAGRLIGKSMSFKSANSGRFNASESKVKMLSPKFSHGQDLKGSKQAKDRSLFERKNSFRLERPLGNSAMATSVVSTMKVDQKLASRGETHSLSSVSNNHELKGVQSDNKLTTLSKVTSYVARRGSEMPVSLGEIKQQSSCLPSVVGASATNGSSSSAEQKPNQTSPKDDPSSNTSDRSFCNFNESLLDGLPRHRESTNLGERIREISVSRSWQNITAGGRNVPCQKCKEMGHTVQFCTVDSPRSLAVDASAARNSREVMNGGSKLKAAIEAAMLKKPGIYRKNRIPDQSDDLPMSGTNLNGEITSHDQLSKKKNSHDQLSISSNTRNMFSADEIHEGQAVLQNSSDDSCIQTTLNNVKQLSSLPTEAVNSKTGDTSDGKPSIRDLPSHASAATSVLNLSAIPEHEYIWQGGLEVYKSGKLPQLFDGIQAHLSTCASPKVLEAVNKFPHKVLLNEVSRSSTWPIQFQETGVTEDNIALYFFAKDLESYERSYKSLLESMMKSDLALKGNLEGVELLIFPSNQLPEKSQRWNMLLFLWGVFRGKRMNCSQPVSGSPKDICLPRDIPTAIMSLPENICSVEPVDMDFSARDRSCNVALASEVPAEMEIPCLPSEINGDCDIKVSSLDSKSHFGQANVGWQDCRLDSTSLSRIQTSSGQLCPGMGCSSTPLEEYFYPDCRHDAGLQPSVQATRTFNGSNRSENWETPFGIQPTTSPFETLPVGTREVGVVGSIVEEKKIPNRMNNSKNQVKFERNLKEEEVPLDSQAALERETVMRDLINKELNSWQLNHRKRPQVDPKETLQAASAGTGQTNPWNEVNSVLVGGSENKKQKTGFSGVYEHNSSRDASSSRDGLASWRHNVGNSFPIKERCDEACDKAVILENSGNAERYFFPVDPHSAKCFNLGDDSMSWKVFSPKDEDWLHDVAPNLELALGAETKLSKQGILPFLVREVDKKNDEDQPPEKLATKGEEDISASLSLSLSFPFPDKEQTEKPVSETEQLLPEGRHVNTSLLLFGGFSDK